MTPAGTEAPRSLPSDQPPEERSWSPLPLDKRSWPVSMLPGQIVVVTTTSVDGRVDAAPKSWVSMASFDPPVVGFGCSTGHRTYRNIKATGRFTVNVLPAALADRAWALLTAEGGARLGAAGLTLLRGTHPGPPRVAQCTAHLECTHDQTVTFGGQECFVFGRIVAADIDERAFEADEPLAAYQRIDPVFYLHDRHVAGLAPPVDHGRRPA